MSRTRQFVRGFLWFAALATILQGGESVLVLTGAGGTSTQIPVFSANPFQAQPTLTGVPTGAFMVLQTPDGQKNYLLSNQGSTGITVYDQNFSNGRTISGGITLAPSTAALSPDGKRLVVLASNIYVFDTATDTLLTPTGLVTAGTVQDIAFSVDGTKAYILNYLGNVGSIITVDLTTNAITGNPMTLVAAGTGIAMGPNGFLYVTTLNRLFEINPRTMAVTPSGEIPVNASPAKPVFTPDGKFALAINRTPITGTSILLFDLTNHTLSGSFPNFSVTLDKLVVAGPSSIYAYSSQTNAIYDVALATGLNVNPSVLQSAIPSNVSSFAISNEIPAKSMYAIATASGASQLYKVDLTNNQAVGQFVINSASGQLVAYANANPTSGGTTLAVYNANQIIQAGAISLPLVARVQDSLGRPVFGARVDFTTTTTGVTITAATAYTNSDGYAQTFTTGPATPGAFTISAASAGTPGGTYTLTVPGTTTGGGGGSTTVATIKIFSGNGQILPEQFSATQPLTVIVTDASGNPAYQVPVTFNITQGRGSIAGLTQVTVNTDTNGQAAIPFTASSVSAGLSFEQATINAACAAGSVNFTLTTALSVLPSGGSAAAPITPLLKPDLDSSGARLLVGGAGTILSDAIEVQVIVTAGVQSGQPIPNVALNVTPADASTPGGTCAGGTPLTDANGIAKCDFQFNNILGTGQLVVNVGGLVNTAPVFAKITTGPPTNITKSSGDKQAAKPGVALPQALRVVVTDSGKNPLPNVTLTWTVASGSATLSNLSAKTDVNGAGTANVTLGGTPGTVTIKVTAGTATNAPSTTFTETINVLVGSMTVISGNNQIQTTGQAFSQPLVVQVNDTSNAALSGISVTFAVASGLASLSATTVTTDSTGRASVTATAGANPGTVLINATASGQSSTFTLTVRQAGPPVTIASFINAASGAAGLTPCGIALAQASGLVPAVTSVISANNFFGSLPTTFQGVNIAINGVSAPIYYVGPSVVAFQTPCETGAGTASIVMTVNGGTTTVTGVTVAALQPGVFETTFTATGTKKYAVLTRPDGSYVTPDNPARRGEQVTLYATGLGQVNPATATGRAGTGAQNVTSNVLVGVNNGGVRLISAQYLAGEIGVYVVTFEIPSDTTAGTYQPLALILAGTDGNSVFSNPSYLPIQ